MEVQLRKYKRVQDQENINVLKTKINAALPTKKPGLTVRGALGEINTNVQVQRDMNVSKVAVAAAEFEKKAILTRATTKSNYSHVQSKIDTGLNGKPVCIQPSARLPLRREESTAGHAVKAAARAKLISLKKHGTVNEVLLNERKVGLKKPLKSVAEKTADVNKVETLKSLNKEEPVSLEKLRLDTPYEDNSITLPEDIEDIDANDKNSPLLLAVYIKDIYNYLTQLEIKYPIHQDYLKNQAVITGKMRATLMDWLVEVQQQFSLVLETFHLTVGIIDRYLQAVPNVQRNHLQLIGVTAMLIASKYEEIYPPDVGDFVYVTDNAYSKADVFRCERDIMSKLGFCLARPIPLSFLRRFIKAAHGTTKQHHLAKYFVDLGLIDYSMVHYKPSELAAAAICLSLYVLSSKCLEDTWTPTLAYYSKYNLDHIEPIMKKIAKLVMNVENSKYKSVYNRYLEPTFAKVSALPQLKGPVILELANSS